jgi:dUTP pyrophosphatase
MSRQNRGMIIPEPRIKTLIPTWPQQPLYVKKLSTNATLPKRGSEFSAGYDLASADDIVIPPLDQRLIKTNIAVMIPSGHYGRIAPRSGLAFKNKIDVHAGVIDEDYRGDVGVILFNHSQYDPFHVKVGDRIAQFIITRIATPLVIDLDSLDETSRGHNGYGSTGV